MRKRNPLYVDPVSELLGPVCSALLARETKRLNAVRVSLIQKNGNIGGSPDGFLYAGKVYTELRGPARHGKIFKPIAKQLEQDAYDLVFLTDRLEADGQILRQSLSVVIPLCRTKQDVRDVLPETLVADIPTFRGIPRQREEGFALNEKPLLKAQYKKAVEIALYYRVNQLIY